MIEQYFGLKELSEVSLRAKHPMQFGSRYIEAGEPVLYFENISMSLLSESNRPIMARGGWANMPRVIWDSRSEVTFSLQEGVLSAVSMSILLGCNVVDLSEQEPLIINKREFNSDSLIEIQDGNSIARGFYISHKPIMYPIRKVFIFEYSRSAIQKKLYGKLIERQSAGDTYYFIAIYEDKTLETPAEKDKRYLIDYYYEYEDKALTYIVEKERFNGLFTLEGKFYSKDENEGMNYTNILYMPKVRVVSDIDLRLGERADPAVGNFTIIGLPEPQLHSRNNVIMEINRLNSDISMEI